jgi:hypothetical protein
MPIAELQIVPVTQLKTNPAVQKNCSLKLPEVVNKRIFWHIHSITLIMTYTTSHCFNACSEEGILTSQPSRHNRNVCGNANYRFAHSVLDGIFLGTNVVNIDRFEAARFRALAEGADTETAGAATTVSRLRIHLPIPRERWPTLANRKDPKPVGD